MHAKQNDPISKEKKINISPINYFELNKLSEDFEKHFDPQMQLSVEQAFWLSLSNPKSEQLNVTQTPVEIEVLKELQKVFKEEVIPFINSLRASFKYFENGLHIKVHEVKTVFNQMKDAVEQYVMTIVMHAESVPVNVLPANSECLMHDNLEIERLEQENDHLFELLLSQDIVHIFLEMFKLDLEPLSPKVLKNRDAHIDYIKHTQENADTLWELVEDARALKPLDNDLDSVGVDLLKGSRGSNLYTLSLEDMMVSSPIYLLSKASKTKSWLWHRRITGTEFVNQNPEMLTMRLGYVGVSHHKSLIVEDTWQVEPKADIGIFLGYAPDNSRLTNLQQEDPCLSLINSHDRVNLLFSTHLYATSTKKGWDTLFQPMFDEYFNPPPSVAFPVPTVVSPEPVDSTSIPSSTTIDQDAPSPSTSQTSQEIQSLVIPSGIEEHFHDIDVSHLDNDPFFGVSIPELNFEESSSRDVIPTNVHSVNQPPEHLSK
ncbi:hypothetical protein Tco_0942788 [Tanacetum coccineum]